MGKLNMIKQNIFIINYNSLYEILDEIKENLIFKITKFENEDDFIKSCKLDIKNSLFISKSNQKLLLNENLSQKNFLSFDSLPLTFNKLTEIININLIKLRFNYQSKVDVKGYELNLNSKFFSRGGLSLKLTEKEIQIILYLNSSEQNHNVLDLQKNIWGYSSNMETHTVETHVYRLRKKISDKFKDENFISSKQDGYFIK
tara:strand:+ start:3997 stop:4599 length:603 start_codon:yes stop_codon:yes gene_type:complete